MSNNNSNIIYESVFIHFTCKQYYSIRKGIFPNTFHLAFSLQKKAMVTGNKM